MKFSLQWLKLSSAALVMTAASSALLAAEEWPNRAVRIIVPSTPGAVQDVVARLIGQKLSVSLGQQFIIENRPGASTNVGTVFVARSKPDGYTYLLSTTSLAWYPDMFKKLPYDPFKDLVNVASVAQSPAIIYAHAGLAANNVKELIALSLKTPQGLDYAGSGVGVTHHLALEELQRATGARFRMIPFNGGTPAMTAVASGQIPFGMLTLGSLRAAIESGKIKPLGLVADKRTAMMPNLPTLAEQGLINIDATVRFPLMGPAGIPQDILNKLADHLRRIVDDPSIKGTFATAGLEPAFLSGPDTTKNMRERADAWRPIIQSLKIQLD